MSMQRPATGRLTPRKDNPNASSAIPEAAAAPTASTRKPAWDRPFRRSKAYAPWWAKTTCGPLMTSGIITPAAANSKPSAYSDLNTETSMGPAVPPVESIRAMVGKDHMWPIDDVWNYHAGGGEFKTIGVFSEALANRYGKSDNVQDFAMKSQLQTYEGVRAMYEAYSRNKYQATGVIQWMLNNAWPSMIWHLYDYYLRPGGGYFGAKRAMEALHPIYGYDDHSIWVVSSQYEDAKGLKLTTKIYDLDMTSKFTQSNPVDAPADSTTKIFTFSDVTDLSPTYFVVLRLEDSSGKLVGSN